MTIFNGAVPPSTPGSQEVPSHGELYEAYKRYTLRLQELREQRHERLAKTLRKDPYRDHSQFLEDLSAEHGQRFVLTPDQFHAWWSALPADLQVELSQLYRRPVEETLQELRSAFKQAFDDRCPQSWQADT